jgi:hypothetical protein
MKRLALCGILVATAACGSSSSPSSPSAAPVANYSGNWSGAYSVTGCTQNGGVALANICGALGNTPPYSMNLSQTGRNVAGTFRLGSIDFPSTGGAVGSDNSLQLNATSLNNGVTIVVSWNLRMATNQMSGTVSQQWASDTLSGGATVAGTINTATRSLAVLAPGAHARDLTRATLQELADLAGK